MDKLRSAASLHPCLVNASLLLEMWAKSLPQNLASTGEGSKKRALILTAKNEASLSLSDSFLFFLNFIYPEGRGISVLSCYRRSGKHREQKIAAEINTFTKKTQLGYAPPVPISLLLPPTLFLSLPLILSGPLYLHTPLLKYCSLFVCLSALFCTTTNKDQTGLKVMGCSPTWLSSPE